MSDEPETQPPGDQPGPQAQPEAQISERCRNGQHSMCRGRVYVFPPVNGKTVMPCGCPICKHPTKWRGRPKRTRP